MAQPLFVVGTVFKDEDAVKLALSKYNEQNYTEFTVTTNNKKTIVIKCKHGRKRSYEGTGRRPISIITSSDVHAFFYKQHFYKQHRLRFGQKISNT